MDVGRGASDVRKQAWHGASSTARGPISRRPCADVLRGRGRLLCLRRTAPACLYDTAAVPSLGLVLGLNHHRLPSPPTKQPGFAAALNRGPRASSPHPQSRPRRHATTRPQHRHGPLQQTHAAAARRRAREQRPRPDGPQRRRRRRRCPRLALLHVDAALVRPVAQVHLARHPQHGRAGRHRPRGTSAFLSFLSRWLGLGRPP